MLTYVTKTSRFNQIREPYSTYSHGILSWEVGFSSKSAKRLRRTRLSLSCPFSIFACIGLLHLFKCIETELIFTKEAPYVIKNILVSPTFISIASPQPKLCTFLSHEWHRGWYLIQPRPTGCWLGLELLPGCKARAGLDRLATAANRFAPLDFSWGRLHWQFRSEHRVENNKESGERSEKAQNLSTKERRDQSSK